MTFEEVIAKYKGKLMDAEFEIVKTERLGWILIMTEFKNYSNPVRQISNPEQMDKLLKERFEM